MAISFYLPKDINTVLKKVVDEGSTKSPNYISSPILSPSILKRNLEKVELVGSTFFNFNVVPLTLPSTHSSGNVLNSRTFDYDFVVANTNATGVEPVFVIDTGSFSFQIQFKTKTIYIEEVIDPDSGMIEEVTHTLYTYSILDSSLDPSVLVGSKNANAFKASTLSNTEEVQLGELIGDISLKVLKEIELPLETTIFTYSENSQEIIFDVIEEIDTILDSDFKRITLLFSTGSNLEFSTLKLAGAVTYQPSLDTFYPNNNISLDIPNLRDYLFQNNTDSYLGYIVTLQPYQGLLFNFEIGTRSPYPYSITTVPNIFEISNLRVFSNVSELFAGQSLVVLTEGAISKVIVTTLNEDPDQNVSVEFEGGTTREWVDFFKTFGIVCRIFTNSNNVTKIFLDRIDNTYTTLDLSIQIHTSSDSTLESSPNFNTLQFNDLPGSNSNSSLLNNISTYEMIGDVFVRTVILAKNNISKDLTSSLSYFGTKKINAIKIKASSANSYDYSDYSSTTNEIVYTGEKTDNLLAYGFEDMLQAIAENLRNVLNLEVVVDKDRGIIFVNNKGKSLDNLYISLKYSDSTEEPIEYVEDSYGSSYNLITDQTQSIVNKSEAFIRLDKNGSTESPVITNNCSYIILDINDLQDKILNIQPYAYRVLSDKVEEQTKYKDGFTVEGSESIVDKLVNGISPFFLAIIPLYDSNFVLTSKVALSIDSISVDSKIMKNLLVWTDNFKTGLSNGYLSTYKGLVGYINGEPTYEDITPIRNSSLTFEGPFVSLNSSYGILNKYGTSALISLSIEESSFEIIVTDLDGNSENSVFTVLNTDTLQSISSQAIFTDLDVDVTDEKLKISIKNLSIKNRLKVRVNKLTSDVVVTDCKMLHENLESYVFMLNRGT